VRMGNGYTENNTIYGNLFADGLHVFDYAGNKTSAIPTDDGGTHVWAPDVIYNKTTGLYYLYYCTTSTWNASNLCYAVSENIEGPYEWKGALIYSGFTKKNLADTNVLDYVSEDYALENYCGSGWNYKKWPNAIDPSVFYDENDRLWMVYGSWSGGMFLLELDPATGEVIHPEADPENGVDPYFGKHLMGYGHQSMEGPYILYDDVSGYYYLFVSYGSLTAKGGYQIRVFRSETVDGEYVDMNGKNYTGSGKHADYGLKMSGNYMLPSLKQAYMATGHNSAFIDDDGKMYVVYHTRYDNGTENHAPRVKQFFLNEEGWPCMLPYATNSETIEEKGYAKNDVVGMYYVVNQGTKINADIAKPFMLMLEEDGKIYGDGIEGTWTMKEGTYYVKITYNNVEYSGVFCAMKDEGGTDVMTFSAVGSNETIWGVKYP
ncbi:MAG: glycoside hydrolase family 43 protein, partial [Lachnospiraceae bacterium]|nr:glycoside hydrolase family 43 protein [Lachnospiraceae bacterium]